MHKSQKNIWREEHIKQKTFTRMHSDKPSQPIIGFTDFLKICGYTPQKTQALDIGCGKGRNSIWLASQGYNVIGVDFVKEAILEARKRNNEKFKKLKFYVVDLTKNWPYKDKFFDVIIDCNSTICIPNPGRKYAISESYRVLKSGGYYIFYGVARTPLVDKSPGPEPNSAIFPKTGKFEKQYSKQELIKVYSEFKIVTLDLKIGKDRIEGKEISYSMWIGIFQKPKY